MIQITQVFEQMMQVLFLAYHFMREVERKNEIFAVLLFAVVLCFAMCLGTTRGLLMLITQSILLALQDVLEQR